MSIARIQSVPGARPVVELGVGNTNSPSGQAVWGTSRWDTAGDRWAGTDPTWLDITCDVHDVEIDQGRDRTISRWQVGTASITVDNTTGRYDIATTPTVPAVLSLRPGRQLRVGVALDGADPVWLGRWFIDAANPTYDPVLEDVVELSCVDAKGQAGKVDIGKVDDPGVGASETVTARIMRVLDAAGWPAGLRDVPAASTTLLATTLGSQAVDLLDVAADSSGGVVFADDQARVVYRPRDWQTYEPGTPVDGIIGNLPPAAGDDIVWTPPPTPAPPTDVLVEPFNNFTAAPWTLTGTPTIVTGRTGTAASFFSTSQRADYNIPAPAQSDTVTVGFAWRHTDSSTVNRNICQLYSDNGTTQHNLLQWNKASGLLIFTRGGATIGSTTFAGVQNTWYYIEIQARLHDSTGFAIVRINGTEVINTGPVDTKNAGTKTVYDQIRILAGTTSLTNQYDDLYVATDPAATFHGDITIPPGPPVPPPVESETVAVTFDADQLVWMAGTVADAVCPSGWEMSFESSDMATRVLTGRSGEEPHVFDDPANQILYGVETFARTDLVCAVPGELDILGNRMLRVLSANFMPTVSAVTIDAGTTVEARNLCATVDPTLPSRYRGFLEQSGRVVFDRQFFAVGVSHRIDPETWTCRIALDDAGPFATVGNRWDDAAWDTGIWAEAVTTLLTEARTLQLELIGAEHG